MIFTRMIHQAPNTGYITMLKDWIIVICVCLYGNSHLVISCIAFEGVVQGTYDTVLPVWLASDDAVGGFALDKKDLGWVLSFVSPMQMATCNTVFFTIIYSVIITCDI